MSAPYEKVRLNFVNFANFGNFVKFKTCEKPYKKGNLVNFGNFTNVFFSDGETTDFRGLADESDFKRGR